MKAREYALKIVYEVMYENGYASLMMRQNTLSKDDMMFVTNLVYGTIRQYALLKFQWQSLVKHAKRKTEVLLNLATFELFIRKTPAYAVINEYVDMCNGNERKFVNAILRQLSRSSWQNSADDSIAYSIPKWLIQLWNAHYGEEITKQILRSTMEIPKVYGRLNTLKMNKAEIEIDSSIHMVDELVLTCDEPLQNTSYFLEGKIVIQNPSSMQPVFFLDVKDDMKVLDVCSAPGTKTQMIAMLMHNTGKIIACDYYEHRLKLVDEMMLKTGVTNVQSIVNDATKTRFSSEEFDRVLCDVPCSGLGDLRHKPEIKYHVTPESIDEIVQMQKQILEISSQYVKPKGILVYSTCTLNKKENENQIRNFLNKHHNFKCLDEKTIFPYENDGDGFYIAKLQKI